ncbi:unannotated protein [freshwater metagenome]|uniref:Unannotated protein n=1 Tax=freshwater metagenome TaxID=449393 RepID=A0A6J6XXX7_9ZZZZ
MTGALTRLTALFVHTDSAPFKALIEIRPGSYAPISPVIEISKISGGASTSEAKTRPSR